MITMKRTSSDEPNVSLRTISYDVLVQGQLLDSFEDVLEAQDYKAKLEAILEDVPEHNHLDYLFEYITSQLIANSKHPLS